jgi:hypothetical protein
MDNRYPFASDIHTGTACAVRIKKKLMPPRLFNCIFSVVLLFFNGRSDGSPEENPGRYCNALFHFCIQYPASLFSERLVYDDQSGILLKTADGLSQVEIRGSACQPCGSPSEVFRETIAKNTLSGNQPLIISTLFGDDFYEVLFVSEGRNFFQKCNFVAGGYVLEEISVPVNRPQLLARAREDVVVNFGN